MEFFKDLETTDVTKMSGLKAGKAAEQAEFDNLLREVEKELDQAASQAPRRRSEDEVRLSSAIIAVTTTTTILPTTSAVSCVHVF